MATIKYIPLAIMLFDMICCTATLARGIQDSAYLKSPMVQRTEDRLTGELKNIPIGGLLEELIKNKQFDCAVKGQLKGVTSISFENLTVDEIIRKILRNNNYNYTILSNPEVADIDSTSGINVLTIYQGDTIVRFSRIASRTTADRKQISQPNAPQTIKGANDRKIAESDKRYSEEITKLDVEIRGFLDDMLDTRKMSKEEYQKAMNEIKANGK